MTPMLRCFRRLPLLVGAILSIWTAGAVAGPVTLVAQTRELEVFASSDNPNWDGYREAGDSDSAPDFGPYAGDISAGAGQHQVSSYAIARQTSTLSADSIIVAGFALANASLVLPEGTSASVSSSNHFEVHFSVSEAADYQLEGSVSAYNEVSLDVTLESIQGAVVHVSVSDGVKSISETGILDPGEYVLLAHASSDCYTDSWGDCAGSGTFEFALRFGTVQVPTDARSVGALKSRYR